MNKESFRWEELLSSNFNIKKFIVSKKSFDQQSYEDFLQRAEQWTINKDLDTYATLFWSKKSWKEHIKMHITSKLLEYINTLPELDQQLETLRLKDFFLSIYPEIQTKWYVYEEYIAQKKDYFDGKYSDVYVKNVECWKSAYIIDKVERVKQHWLLESSQALYAYWEKNEFNFSRKKALKMWSEVEEERYQLFTHYATKFWELIETVDDFSNLDSNFSVTIHVDFWTTTAEENTLKPLRRSYECNSKKDIEDVNTILSLSWLFLLGTSQSQWATLIKDISIKPKFLPYPWFIYTWSTIKHWDPQQKIIMQTPTTPPTRSSAQPKNVIKQEILSPKTPVVEIKKETNLLTSKPWESIKERTNVPNLYIVYKRNERGQLIPKEIMNQNWERIPYQSWKNKLPKWFQYPDK